MTHPHQLVRALSLVDASALVVGTVIGTGVFLKAAPMAQAVGSPMWVLLAWVAAGLLSLAGALTYAELSSMMPHAGGEYVYLRKSYGEPAAFLFGWQRFIVAGSASIASLGVGFSNESRYRSMKLAQHLLAYRKLGIERFLMSPRFVEPNQRSR